MNKQSKLVSKKESGFLGGAVGYFSFEYIHCLEKFSKTKQVVDFPTFEFGIFKDVIVFDHKQKKVMYKYIGKSRLKKIQECLQSPKINQEKFKIKKIKCNLTPEKFCEKVKTAKKHIIAGDIFQTVISKRYEIDFSGSLLPFYKQLKQVNPSPYLFYLKFEDRQIIGSSPENLIRIQNNKIESYATLAGTRKRGKNKKEDQKLEKELLQDSKECTEHIMLVDLTRNDVGKIAIPGTVKVPELMQVHKYSHVQHLASLVTGKLKQGKTTLDALNSIFPAGTVSGAPKIRAVQILSKLEKTNRGPYGGAVGYFSVNGNMDFAIILRTLFANKNKAYIQTGAGIVYDSDPKKEFQETENKAKALLQALKGSESK